MNTFIFKDQEIASLGLEEEIRRRVLEKTEKGIYNREEIENVSERRLDIFLDVEENSTFRPLHYLYGNWDVTREFQITSHRAFIGPFIVAIKKFIRFLVRLYTKTIFKKQSEFNRDSILLSREIIKELRNLRKDIEALKR